MQGLQQSYTQYFNRKHHKVGHLFQGRYQAIVCDQDEYLLGLVRYIHLNPIRAKMVRKLEEYPYSGHRHYVEGGVSEVLEPGRVLDLLGGRAGYRRFVLEGLKEGHREDYYQVEDQRFLGAEEFAQKLKLKVNEQEMPRRKKQLSVVFRRPRERLRWSPRCLKEQIEAGRSRNRGRWSDMY